MNGSILETVVSADHPYFPLGTLMTNFTPNTIASPTLVLYFALGSGAILGTAYAIIKSARPSLSLSETSTALWFVLCGFIHFFFEGYFAYNFYQMPSRTDLFGQLWKEYSLSDSRYLTQDSFVVTMETITAVCWGPLSFVCAWAIATSHPIRHPLQLIISLGQLYGDVLYYATCTFAVFVQGVHFCRPEDFYFWAYYFLCNAFWIVIPGILIWSSIKATKKAFAQVQAAEKGKKKN